MQGTGREVVRREGDGICARQELLDTRAINKSARIGESASHVECGLSVCVNEERGSGECPAQGVDDNVTGCM